MWIVENGTADYELLLCIILSRVCILYMYSIHTS